jgi:hypothetical protein
METLLWIQVAARSATLPAQLRSESWCMVTFRRTNSREVMRFTPDNPNDWSYIIFHFNSRTGTPVGMSMETTYSPRLVRFIAWWMRNPHPSSLSARKPLWDMDKHVARDEKFWARNLLSSRLIPQSSFFPFRTYVFPIFFGELDSLTIFIQVSKTLPIHNIFLYHAILFHPRLS